MANFDWGGIRERVLWLGGQSGAGKVFGAGGHQWVLEPPLSGPELDELEEQLGVRLPEEYRGFLREVGRGGAGPAYGVFGVRRGDAGWRWEGDGAELTDLARLGRPFAHEEAFNPVEGLEDPPDEGDFDTVEAFEEAADAYQERYDAVAFSAEHSVGLLYLCHLGCALREGLVVSGPSRGQMWADDRADGAGFRPLAGPDGGRVGFAEWYQGWLDRAERLVGERYPG